MHASYLTADLVAEALPGVIVVDLDKNRILAPEDQPHIPFPMHQREKLYKSLSSLNIYQRHQTATHQFNIDQLDLAFANAPPPDIDIDPPTTYTLDDDLQAMDIHDEVEYIRGTVLRCFVSLMMGYKKCLLQLSDNVEDRKNESAFDFERFLKKKPSSTHYFYEQLFMTQGFLHFCEERVCPSQEEMKYSTQQAWILFFELVN